MSKTGSIGEGLATVPEPLATRTRISGKRIQPQRGEHPAFLQHVLMLERVERNLDLNAPVRPRADNETVELKNAEYPVSQKDTIVAKSAIRLADDLNLAVLEIEQAQHMRDAPTLPSSGEVPSQNLSKVESQLAGPPRPSSPTSRTVAAFPIGERAEVRPAPVQTGKAPAAQLPGDSGTARGALSNNSPDLLGSRAIRSEVSQGPEEFIDTPRHARQLRTAGTGRAFVSMQDTPVKVVRQETHFAPLQRLSPIVQIAEALVFRLEETGEAQQAPSLLHSPSLKAPTGTVVRHLTIQLEPAELGTVSIRMRLDGDVLELTLDAQKPATAELIRRDQGALSGLLRSAGYDVEGVIVQVADADRTLAGNGPQASPHSASTQAQLGSSQPEGRSGGTGSQEHRSDNSGGRLAAQPGGEPGDSEPVPLRPRGFYV